MRFAPYSSYQQLIKIRRNDFMRTSIELCTNRACRVQEAQTVLLVCNHVMLQVTWSICRTQSALELILSRVQLCPLDEGNSWTCLSEDLLIDNYVCTNVGSMEGFATSCIELPLLHSATWQYWLNRTCYPKCTVFSAIYILKNDDLKNKRCNPPNKKPKQPPKQTNKHPQQTNKQEKLTQAYSTPNNVLRRG